MIDLLSIEMKSECCQEEIEMNESGLHGWCSDCKSLIIFDRKGQVRKLKFADNDTKTMVQTSLFDNF